MTPFWKAAAALFKKHEEPVMEQLPVVKDAPVVADELVMEAAPKKWTPPPDMTGKERIIVWHVRPDTNYRTAREFHRNVNIKPWPEGTPFPDRGNAYAYQVGMGSWRKRYGQPPKEWAIEMESLGPMVYFGTPVRKDDGLYCEDDRGELHGPLEDGESIEPIEPGITVTHYPDGHWKKW